MGRVTRAKAAEAAEAAGKTSPLDTIVSEVPDENAELLAGKDKQQESPSEREPLGDITPNASVPDEEETTTTATKKKTTKGKRGGKKKGKASKTATPTPSPVSGGVSLPEVAIDDVEDTSSQAVDEAAEDLMKDLAKDQGSDMAVTESTKAAIPSSTPPVKSTRSQLKSAAAQLADQPQDTPDIVEVLVVEEGDREANETSPMEVSALEAPQSPLPSAVPNVIASLRKDHPGQRSTSNKENVEPMERPETPRPSTAYDALEAAVVEAATPPVPSRTSLSAPTSEVASPQVQSPIEALDELEDAVEKVTAELPKVEKLPPKIRSKKPAPIVRTTKASQARISMAHGEKDGKLRTSSIGKPRPSSVMGRSTTLGQSAGSRPQSSYNKRVPSSGSDKSEDGEKKEAVIPHSKPRPISMSFPEPPKPIKSTKAPTKSTFQLPGEAVAAKLKAAREERLKKESEEAQNKASFKARPAPSFAKKAPVVRQTNSSKFRESIATGKDARTVSAELGHKRANSAAAPIEKKKETTVSKTNPVKLAARPSTSLANISKPRASIIAEPRQPGKGTSKGKEVFNRPAMAKEQAEKERREKEEAAKKARAEAAERGRQASREWAEKQKQRKLKDAAEAKQAAAAVAA